MKKRHTNQKAPTDDQIRVAPHQSLFNEFSLTMRKSTSGELFSLKSHSIPWVNQESQFKKDFPKKEINEPHYFGIYFKKLRIPLFKKMKTGETVSAGREGVKTK